MKRDISPWYIALKDVGAIYLLGRPVIKKMKPRLFASGENG
jgi:hypothetical protein